MQSPVPGEVGAPDPARALLDALPAWALEGFERSFKMTPGRLLGERFLAGVSTRSFSSERVLQLCSAIRMPGSQLRQLPQALSGATTVHFGFEGASDGAPGGGTFKVYLEFADRLRTAPLPGSFLLHLAFKWDAAEPARSTTARYVCHPGLSYSGLLQRMDRLYAGGAPASREVIHDVLEAARARSSAPPMYLEVSEDENPRMSFDLNVHHAELGVREVAPALERLGETYRLERSRVAALLETVAHRRLGHVSGGVERGGRDFLTVYYQADPS